MNTRLAQLFNTLEAQRTELLCLIQGISPETATKAPQGKWSIHQVISHLIASEQLSVKYLNKKILGIETAPKTGLTEELKMIMLKISQRFPFKFKAPKVVVENTPVYESLEELTEAWNKTRAELLTILEKFKDNQINRKVYKHPFAGMLNIQQALVFVHEHIFHHTPQIKKLLKQN
ncbi:MAG: DinB family protein [Cyclobacteriaceae bacterium]|nr:DinB family protein [Cyclobacteriaceae bacterium]